jgi:hypothetical protein
MLWGLVGHDAFGLVFVAVLAGELADRLEFYLELDPTTPESQMRADLRKALPVKGCSAAR